MAAELITPHDELTHMPLPIAPERNQLPLNKPREADWHHPFHPNSHPLLQGLGGRALRHSRVQLVNINFHNQSKKAYHYHYDGPQLPTTEDEQFRLVVIACAGYIPEEGIDLSTGDPHPVRLQPWQIDLLRAPRLAQEGFFENAAMFGYRNLRYDYDAVRKFFSAYALKKPLDHLPQNLTDEFLHTTNEERKSYLGHLLLAKKIEVAAEEVTSQYAATRQAGLLHPRMPSSPQTLVKHKLGRPERRELLFGQLRQSLLGQAS